MEDITLKIRVAILFPKSYLQHSNLKICRSTDTNFHHNRHQINQTSLNHIPNHLAFSNKTF